MIYRVLIGEAAERDLQEIYDWISEDDSISHADHVLDELVRAAESIATFPERGSRPKDLLPSVNGDFRQVLFKPYCVVYEVKPTEVLIHLIADGRRNLQSLLLRRLSEDQFG